MTLDRNRGVSDHRVEGDPERRGSAGPAAREAALREVLNLIGRSREDAQPVFDAIVHRAADLCAAAAAALIMGKVGDAHLRLAAHCGAHPATVARYDRGEVSLDPGGSFGAQAIVTGKLIHIPDVLDTDFYRQGSDLYASIVRDSGVRTQMVVPLLTPKGAIGAFVIFRREVRPFTADEITLAETFAAQAVIAIQNAQQFHELQTRLEREAATREILEVISRSRDDVRPVFERILQSASRLCAAQSAALLLANEARTHARLMAIHGDTLSAFEGTDLPLDAGHAPTEAIRTGSCVHIADERDTDLYRDGDPVRARLVEEAGLRSSLAVPLMRDDLAIGAIVLHHLHEVRPFSDDDIGFLKGFAAQTVIAIENVRQFKALETLNAELGERVRAQVGEIERMGRLKRFLPAAVADAVVSSGSELMLSSHRALLGVLFCDIRGFTAFCETAEPEETIEVLQTFHEEMGRLIADHGAGVDHRMGDGIMVLFNDPLPCADPAGAAVRLGMAMRARMEELCARWRKLGHRLGFGVGVSLGYATVGMVGSGGRFDYTASGTAVNLAERLCGEAQDGEILISPRARNAVEETFETVLHGTVALKGIREPVEVHRVVGPRLPAAPDPRTPTGS